MKNRNISKFIIVLVIGQGITVVKAQPPAYFDLRDVDGANLVTSVKSQIQGTCWTHGAMAAMEGNLLMTGAWEEAGEIGEPDLAEYHLDWWNGFNQHNNDDIIPPTGSGLTVHRGGDYLVTEAYLARGEGAVRDTDGQSFDDPPDRWAPGYHYYHPRHIEWYEAGADLSGIDEIKYAIMETGVMGTCMAYNFLFINSEYVHYQPEGNDEDPNHAVAIVGWDDTIECGAPGPGAWICKNSWGEEWGENGFFWISYYDKWCCKHPEMGAVSFKDIEPMSYDEIYFHDYHGWRDTMEEYCDAFNAFQADDDELINAVNFCTATDSVWFEATIYDTFDVELSEVRGSVTGFIQRRGMHTVDLESPILIRTGDDFYVRLSLSEGGHAYDRTSDIPVLLGASYRVIVESTSEPGQSFFQSDGEWHDLYTVDSSANFCIKALTSRTGIRIDPDNSFRPNGETGGPFDPPSMTYCVRNRCPEAIEYAVVMDTIPSWLMVSGLVSGLLEPDDSVHIMLSINESEAGELPAGAYSTTVGFVNTTNHLGDTSREIILAIGGRRVYHQWLLDDDPGWNLEGNWAFGTPGGSGGSHGAPDPSGGYTGFNVYGYNLEGDYEDNLPQRHLTTSPFDCTDLYNVRLKFWRWLGVEGPNYDQASVSVSNDGNTWALIWINPDEVTDDTWIEQEFDISESADDNPIVYVRWTMGPTDDGWVYCGWNIDDIRILAHAEGDVPWNADGTITNPDVLRLNSIQPNPIRGSASICYTLPSVSHVRIELYDIVGRSVATILNRKQPRGSHRTHLDIHGVDNTRMSQGIYMLRLSSETESLTKPLIVIR